MNTLYRFLAILCMTAWMMPAKAQEHDYSKDYLTLDIISSGTLKWKAEGSNATKTIEYSINDGVWTSVTSTTAGVTINVVAGNHVRLRGTNTQYCNANRSNYTHFADGTATFNISGNMMSLTAGDNFASVTTLPGTWTFCQFFKQSKCISAENLILPATTLTDDCYRAMFSLCTTLVTAPQLPATTLAKECYWYMFEACGITTAPDLLAPALENGCYGHMFVGCSNLNYIKCLATSEINTTNLNSWVGKKNEETTLGVAATGTFVKENGIDWSTITGTSGIPTGWSVDNYLAAPEDPVITCDGEFITITCQTYGASIYYRLGQEGSYSLYSAPIAIHENTVVEAYAVKNELQSNIVIENCIAIKSYRFAGMELTSGPLYYGNNGYEIKEGWNYDSYNSIYGKTVGSTYFNFIELGQLFESSVFSTSDGDIDKVLDPLDSWRVPTNAEWASILGTTRSGSTVNGASNKHYAMIQLADVSGLLIFPDGVTITGVALSNMDNTTPNDITESDLNEYLSQGCVFLPGSGFYDGSWNSGNYYWSSTENNSLTGYVSSGDNKNKETNYFPVYLVKDAADEATRLLRIWTYNGNKVELPYSVNAIDGHSGNYAKGTFDFTTDVKLKESQPTYLWFQHADQSATVYVDNSLVEKHWGGYNAFFVDISSHVHPGTNNIKVAIKNNEGTHLAPCAGDFNFNATLGEVKLISSPVVPDPDYGYDGFHITSTVTAASATITVKTSVPTGATLTCTIKGDNCDYSGNQTVTDEDEITFTTTINNPHLWNGTLDPYLYDVTLTIAKDGVVYHKFKRGYGLRFYEYVVDNETPANSRFYLNGSPYLLRGVCMHSDLEGKANALTAADIDNDFEILKELGCNFVRLAHYPHPKEVYDWCDKLGIVVQTEVPWVNQSSSGQPEDYYTNLVGQYNDMVNQHYNHPCILFWGLANEITPSTVSFTKEKIEQYYAQIKALDSERLVGFVMSHSYNNPTSFDSPNIDWFGCNIYVGWYVDKNSNNPTGQLNTRMTNFITNGNKPFAFSEYGCGGTQSCHSEDPWNTTTKGTNQPRHDIEYLMWLHEGHIAAIKNFPQLLFTSQWQLFDIAVYNRQEGYKVCKDGEATSVYDNDELKYLNNKGLVERDHKTKKDPFYLYKAWWNQTDKFVHICGKDYKKTTGRVIKCYTNDGSTLKLYINNEEIETATVTNNIATFTARTFTPGDVIRVTGDNSDDTFTIANYNVFTTEGNWDEASNWSAGAVPAAGCDVDIIANATVPSDCTANAGNVTLYGSTTLTIDDGGQLYHNNEGVVATVKKSITGYGGDNNGGWNFIASPLAGTTPAPSVENLISPTAANYDLYYYDEAAHYWRNYKPSDDQDHPNVNPGFDLNNGQGYLYANYNNVELQFTGTLQAGTDGSYTVSNLSHSATTLTGFNLVGNPFACNATIDRPAYVINGGSIEAYQGGQKVISPCEGVMVQADATYESVTFTKVIPDSQATPTQPSSLQIALNQGNTLLDNAIVSFNEGTELDKFYFSTQNANIYLPQNGKDYAIVSVGRDGVHTVSTEIPVNFKANENGQYTIAVNPEGVEMNYLHLIDNMTGADVDLLTLPSYTFTAKTTDYESRFKLVFSICGDANGDHETFAYINNGNIIITADVEGATLQVIDVMGRVIVSRKGDVLGNVSTNGMTPGVYVLRLINGNEMMTQKIVVR